MHPYTHDNVIEECSHRYKSGKIHVFESRRTATHSGRADCEHAFIFNAVLFVLKVLSRVVL